jgi:hypothetical protein
LNAILPRGAVSGKVRTACAAAEVLNTMLEKEVKMTVAGVFITCTATKTIAFANARVFERIDCVMVWSVTGVYPAA